MRTLILLSLCALAAVCIADSSESNEIDDVLFLGRKDAHLFVRPPRRNNPWERRMYKAPYELNRERCEEFQLCNQPVGPVSSRRMYSRIFGNARQHARSHPRRRNQNRKQYYRY
ncbi:matrix Gla protein-like [Pristis pectinata]|uniref:matrix Gla protein-like n=1 Tax=Pristis pectinata TaxID=685728 RepID=UPI00223CE411|nr:matrix Gla protein-like [Pristis pectinata]